MKWPSDDDRNRMHAARQTTQAERINFQRDSKRALPEIAIRSYSYLICTRRASFGRWFDLALRIYVIFKTGMKREQWLIVWPAFIMRWHIWCICCHRKTLTASARCLIDLVRAGLDVFNSCVSHNNTMQKCHSFEKFKLRNLAAF